MLSGHKIASRVALLDEPAVMPGMDECTNQKLAPLASNRCPIRTYDP